MKMTSRVTKSGIYFLCSEIDIEWDFGTVKKGTVRAKAKNVDMNGTIKQSDLQITAPIVDFSQDTFGGKTSADQYGTIKKSSIRVPADSPVVLSPSAKQKLSDVVISTYPGATVSQVDNFYDSLYQIDSSEDWSRLFIKLSDFK
eukprot:NODE_374_length_9848_cov_0.468971.p7 type:complete len:144 gc:universal NODE_374_length_9848_cov_0.468971:2144-2575(+)